MAAPSSSLVAVPSNRPNVAPHPGPSSTDASPPTPEPGPESVPPPSPSQPAAGAGDDSYSAGTPDAVEVPVAVSPSGQDWSASGQDASFRDPGTPAPDGWNSTINTSPTTTQPRRIICRSHPGTYPLSIVPLYDQSTTVSPSSQAQIVSSFDQRFRPDSQLQTYDDPPTAMSKPTMTPTVTVHLRPEVPLACPNLRGTPDIPRRPTH